jgi:hypothetical protein
MEMIYSNKEYEKYRWFFTSDGKLVIGGKSDKQNEEVIKKFNKPDFIVMHTSLPGSPFCIILSKKPSKKDIEETAIFCASFSSQWKTGKKDISVDIFSGSQIYKVKLMKTGTFGVKGNVKKLNIRPELVLVMQKGKLRAVPKTTKEEVLVKIKQGNLSKIEASDKILKIIKSKYAVLITKDDIMSAIPSDKLSVE